MEKSTEKQMLVPVIPLVPLPFGRSPIFSYLSLDPLPPGTLVSVPFGPRTVHGVVWDDIDTTQKDTKTSKRRSPRKNIRYRPIKTTFDMPLMPEATRRVAEYIAGRYFTPLGRVLEDMLPKGVFPIAERKKRDAKKTEVPAPWIPLGFGVASEVKPSSDQLRAARDILKKRVRLTYLFGPSASGKTLVCQRIIRDQLKKSGQALVLVPDRIALFSQGDRYESVFGTESVAIVHSDLSPSALRKLRADVSLGKKRIIIGTRQALFLPFRELSVLMLLDEESVSYKQFSLSPRYDARRVAEKLGELSGALVLFGSSAPSVSEYLRAREHGALVTLSSHVLPPRIEIVNLRIERWKKRYQPISRDLEEAIRETLLRKEQILLVVGRGGMNAFSVCVSCKAIFRCSNCGKPYRYEREGFFRCHACGSKTDETPHCPACHSLEFRHIGVGTERVERDFERRFPGTSIVRRDAETNDRADTLKKLREFLSGKRSVLITTASGASGWSLPRLGLVAMIEADSGFGFSGWNADEEAFRALVKVAGCVAASKRGVVILQTFHPENHLFQYLINGSIERFIEDTQEERRALLYPPYAELIRVRYEATTDRSLAQAVSLLEKRLASLQGDYPKAFRYQVFPSSSNIRRRKPIRSQEVLLRIARPEYGGSPELDAAVHSLLLALPSYWTVDIDPFR